MLANRALSFRHTTPLDSGPQVPLEYSNGFPTSVKALGAQERERRSSRGADVRKLSWPETRLSSGVSAFSLLPVDGKKLHTTKVVVLAKVS